MNAVDCTERSYPTAKASDWEQFNGFLDEIELLKRVPVCRRTLANWKAKGLLPFVKIGRRCLYDWQNVRAALLRLEHNRGVTG